MDAKGFAEAIITLRKSHVSQLSVDDYRHLRKIIWFNRLLMVIGLGTAWYAVNPLSVLCFSIAATTGWCIVAHHVLHGGYDKVPGVPQRYRSERFAKGWRRFLDWNDWLYPPAWHYEHNILHHHHTNGPIDPDRGADKVPMFSTGVQALDVLIKGTILLITIFFWRPVYYTTNTLKALKEGKEYNSKTYSFGYFLDAFFCSYLFYIPLNFILLPAAFLPLGTEAAMCVLINRLLAELVTAVHSFFLIVPNHTGDDIPVFDGHFSSREEYFLRQATGSCNYTSSNPVQDYLYGYLNYQIEHHLFPDMPASQYPKLQPKIKALCQQYGVPYKEASLWKRSLKMVSVLVGACTPAVTTALSDAEEIKQT